MTSFKKAILLVIVSSILWITGCSPFVENNEIEEIAPVIFWSLDDAGEGKLKVCTVVPPLVKEKQRLLTMNVELLKQGGKTFNFKYYRELKTGQLRILLINEELAKKGMKTIIDTVFSDPNISQRLYLVIVRGNFEEYIKNELQDKQENPDYFLYRMLKHYEEKHQGEMSIVNLHQFMEKLYGVYSDPILPVFKAEKGRFTYEGTAIFQDDKLISTVSHMEDQIYQLIGNDDYLKYLPMTNLSTVLGQVRSNMNMALNQDLSTLTVNVELTGTIDEYRGTKNLNDLAEITVLKTEIESYLETKTKAFLQKSQEWNVDPLQIGTKTFTPFTKPMSEEKWFEKWSNMKINVNYHLELEPLIDVQD
ncbi:Ger(x)C family spore germination protein [Peribacillus sp. NPDC076916]|uniref:Ger(x)C family spore germination protein n=1 Tax=Peribacillus sp. NPDC076916 TaxID=3390608 RepID=UPI003D042069